MGGGTLFSAWHLPMSGSIWYHISPLFHILYYVVWLYLLPMWGGGFKFGRALRVTLYPKRDIVSWQHIPIHWTSECTGVSPLGC